MPTYQIHFNGGRPYTVEVEGDEYHMTKTHLKITDENGKLVFEGDTEVWIGIDPRTEATSCSTVNVFEYLQTHPFPETGLDWRFDGCEILFINHEGELIWLKEHPCKLSVDPKNIVHFVSPMGNSNCPYSYIVTKTHYLGLVSGISYPRFYTDGTYHCPNRAWWHDYKEENVHTIPRAAGMPITMAEYAF